MGRTTDGRDDLRVRRLGHVAALDGLRGVAILLVVGRHYFNLPGGGEVGVGLFFVLSGFLITTLLLEEHGAAGRIRLRAFYARRVRRLIPALVVMLAVYLVGAVIEGRAHPALKAVASGAFYTANIAQAYWPHLIGHEPLGPLWSLAEEEQFYLLWPALLIVALTMAFSFRRLKLGILLAILLICAERFWLVASHANYQRTYESPESAADALLAGVLLAFVLFDGRAEGNEGTRDLALPALVALGILTLFSFSIAVEGLVIDVAGAVVVALAVHPRSLVSRVLSWRPLVGLGLISYSLYLWFMVVLSWFDYRERGLALAVSIAVAWLSYRLVETRFRRRRPRAVPATEWSRKAPIAAPAPQEG